MCGFNIFASLRASIRAPGEAKLVISHNLVASTLYRVDPFSDQAEGQEH